MDALVQQVLAHDIVREQLECHTDNTKRMVFRDLTSTPDNLQKVESILSWWAQEVAEVIVKNDPPVPDQSDPDWKEKVSSWTYHALDFPSFEASRVPMLAEKFAELGGESPEDYIENGKMAGMVPLSLLRITMAAAAVAYMMKLGLDPNLLLMTSEEADRETLAMIETMADAGKPVIGIVVPPTN